jgi:dTDP-4-amino-4,6-dideoxygalactose transaminase
VDAELEAAFRRVLRSGCYILGPEVDAFENDCANACEARHAIGVSSGTDALLLALMSLGIGPGDEVICPTYTYFATAGVIERVGARPVFVDVAPASYHLDVGDLERKLTTRTRAVIPVHLFGQCADMRAILSLAQRADVIVVEDAAQAFGAKHAERCAGSMGRLGCFSFFPSKILSALGDAGLLVTSDDALAERARVLRVQGAERKHHHTMIGGNFRLDPLQAALLCVRAKRMDEAIARREANAAFYTRLFREAGIVAAGAIVLPDAPPLHGRAARQHVFNQYIVRVRGPTGARESLQRALTEAGVETAVYYPVPMHLQPCFRHLGYRPGDFPCAEAAATETLALPMFPELHAEEVEYVVNAVVSWARRTLQT